jgi:hypothetical protein
MRGGRGPDALGLGPEYPSKGVGVTEGAKECINCGRPLDERVEEEERTGTGTSQSTGECATYRVWFCVNPDCTMFKTDLYKEIAGPTQ